MIVRKKYLLGGLIKGLSGKIIKGVVKGDKYKKFSQEVKKRVSEFYKGKDKTLKKHEEKLRKIEPMEEALEDIIRLQNTKQLRFSTGQSKQVKDATRDALNKIKEFKKQKKAEVKAFIESKGRTKNFKGGLIKKPRLAKRGF